MVTVCWRTRWRVTHRRLQPCRRSSITTCNGRTHDYIGTPINQHFQSTYSVLLSFLPLARAPDPGTPPATTAPKLPEPVPTSNAAAPVSLNWLYQTIAIETINVNNNAPNDKPPRCCTCNLHIKPYTGTTVYTVDEETGLITKHTETWDISALDAFVSSIFPGFGAPPAPPVSGTSN